MLLLDPRAGSGDLVAWLTPLGVPATTSRLEFGDVAFVGNGPNDLPHQVGLEVKTIGDVVNCMTSGRFAAHQLPGLLRDYDEAWLLIEGQWRPSVPDGLLQVYHPSKHFWFTLKTGGRQWMWKDVQGWVQSMMVLGGVKVWCSPDRAQLAAFIAGLYRWWQKPFGDHSSLKTFVDYKARVGGASGQPAMLRAPSFERRVYKELPGIGWEKSGNVEMAFPDVLTAVQADAAAWQRIPGVGPTIATRITRALRGLK